MQYAFVLVLGLLCLPGFPLVSLTFLIFGTFVPVLQLQERKYLIQLTGLYGLGLIAGRIIHQDGIFWNELYIVGFSIAVAFLLFEIIHGKRTEFERGQTTSLYKNVLNRSTDAIFQYDRVGKLEAANNGFEKLIVQPVEQVIGHSILEYIEPDDYKLLMLNQNSKQRISRSYDLRFVRSDGEVRTTLINELPLFRRDRFEGVQAIATDITNRKRMEEKLLRLAVVVEQSADMVMITDTEGRIQYVNPAFERVTQFSAQEAIGNTPRIVKSEKQSPEFYKDLWENIQQGNVWKGHLINKKKDGAFYEEECTISPLFDEAGNITNFVALKRDVTKELSLERQLQQAQKMEAVGQLAGGIAHDFNNILTGIMGNLSLADKKANEEIRDYLVRANEAATRASKLVRQLLVFSRKSQFKLHPISLNRIVEETVQLIRQTIDRRIGIETRLADDLPLIQADITQLNRVIMNLCINGRDAIQSVLDGETQPERQQDRFFLSLETKTEVLTRPLHNSFGNLAPGHYVILSISDNGAGMDLETQKHIFEPFFTTKKFQNGTGLGLASSYGVIKQHKGLIQFFSTVGKGTTFTIYFPTTEKHEKESLAIPAQSQPKEEHKTEVSKTILLVDDEEVIRDFVKAILRQDGYTILEAKDGQETLDVYQNQENEIDLIILDLSLPQLSGREVLKRIRSQNKRVKVLISSGYSEDQDFEALNALGIEGFLAKPYKHTLLEETVEKILQK